MAEILKKGYAKKTSTKRETSKTAHRRLSVGDTGVSSIARMPTLQLAMMLRKVTFIDEFGG